MKARDSPSLYAERNTRAKRVHIHSLRSLPLDMANSTAHEMWAITRNALEILNYFVFGKMNAIIVSIINNRARGF